MLLRALRSEAAKFATVRLWWVLALIMFVYVGFTAVLLGGLFGAIESGVLGAAGQAGPQQPMPPGMLAPMVYSSASTVGYVFPVLLGALAMTAEFRHQTLTPTFLATPRRGIVLAAKAVVALVAGAVFGIIGLAASMGLGAPVLGLVGVDPQLGDPDIWALAARTVLALALWSAIGVGLGVLVPSQVAAIVIVVAFTQFVEPILRLGASVWEWTAQVGRFLPGAASDALVGASVFTAFGAGGSVDPLEWWQGALVLTALAVVALVVGALTSWRRDVT